VSVVLIGATRPEHLDNAIAALASPMNEQVLDRLEENLTTGAPA
jgi:aryl-alcohol dehydrogenase-like predicted oxidoreductase